MVLVCTMEEREVCYVMAEVGTVRKVRQRTCPTKPSARLATDMELLH